jgi:hypothetical protein
MGKLNVGILGPLSGKVAGVVGSQWKDKHVLRAYAIPSNPDTTPQQIQRTKFRVGVKFLKMLVGQVFKVYVDKFQKSMSGFNYAISQNIAYCLSPITYSSIRIVWGNLWGIVPTLASYDAGTLSISWDKTLVGNNGSQTDKVYCACYDYATLRWWFPAAAVARSVETLAITDMDTVSYTTLKLYIWAAKYSSTSPTLLEEVSSSAFYQPTA